MSHRRFVIFSEWSGVEFHALLTLEFRLRDQRWDLIPAISSSFFSPTSTFLLGYFPFALSFFYSHFRFMPSTTSSFSLLDFLLNSVCFFINLFIFITKVSTIVQQAPFSLRRPFFFEINVVGICLLIDFYGFYLQACG